MNEKILQLLHSAHEEDVRLGFILMCKEYSLVDLRDLCNERVDKDWKKFEIGYYRKECFVRLGFVKDGIVIVLITWHSGIRIFLSSVKNPSYSNIEMLEL